MKTKYILHGGYTGRPNEDGNINFYREWVKDFQDDYIPTILVFYHAREKSRWEDAEKNDKERFAKYTNNRKVNFVIASDNLDILREQIKKADVVYIRGGSSKMLFESLKPIKDELLGFIKGKVYAGSSAGVMILSQWARSHTTTEWVKGFGLLPIVSFVHWDEKLQPSLDKFKEEHKNENWEYLLIPEAKYIVKEY